jgi:SAM-dependent methyltransferase
MKAYTSSFYHDLNETSAPTARIVWPMVLDLAPVQSAVDIGCGNGSWLKVLKEFGVKDVLGIDGPWIAPEQVNLADGEFVRMPLEEPITRDRCYDLASCLEVAEHLTPGRADGLVEDLTRLAPLVLFSAAAPMQGGVNHLNEQWPSYWAEKFARRGYRVVDCLRQHLLAREDVSWWYGQNIMLFASPEALSRYPKLAAAAAASPETPPPIAHPRQYLLLHAKAHPDFKAWWKEGGAAFRRTFRKKKKTA